MADDVDHFDRDAERATWMGRRETRRRSIVKTLSWRVLATGITTSVTYALTGQWELAATVGLADAVIKLGAYYAHERAWGRIAFGLEGIESNGAERSQKR